MVSDSLVVVVVVVSEIPFNFCVVVAVVDDDISCVLTDDDCVIDAVDEIDVVDGKISSTGDYYYQWCVCAIFGVYSCKFYVIQNHWISGSRFCFFLFFVLFLLSNGMCAYV